MEAKRERIREMKIENKIDSDYQPVEAIIKRKKKGSRRSGVDRRIWRGIWNEEGRRNFTEESFYVNNEGKRDKEGNY